MRWQGWTHFKQFRLWSVWFLCDWALWHAQVTSLIWFGDKSLTHQIWWVDSEFWKSWNLFDPNRWLAVAFFCVWLAKSTQRWNLARQLWMVLQLLLTKSNYKGRITAGELTKCTVVISWWAQYARDGELPSLTSNPAVQVVLPHPPKSLYEGLGC